MAYTYGAVTLTNDTILECQSVAEMQSLTGGATTWNTTIDGQTVANTDIKKVEIGTSVTSLPRMFCYACSALETVVLSSSLTSIGEVFCYECDSLSKVNVGNAGATIIDDSEEAVLGMYSFGTTNSSASCYVNGVGIIAGSDILANAWLTKFNTITIGPYRRLVKALKFYGSVNGQTKLVEKLYGSVNGQTKEIKKLYGSVNGQTKLIYSS